MGKVVVVGSFNVDHVWRCEQLPAPGATLAGQYESGPGGKGFNQAVAARRAGADATFICALGEDAGGALARCVADADGLLLLAQASHDPTGTAGIYVDHAGRNSIVIGAGANAALSADFIAAQAVQIGNARVVLTQLESPLAAVACALRLARQHGVATILNPAPANAATTAELLALADILTPNETEFAALLARHADTHIAADQVATLADAELHALCRRLSASMTGAAATLIITLGAHGAFVSHAAQHLRGDAHHACRIAAEPAQAVDTTGAGDAFTGALAASLAQAGARPFIDHVRFANRYAARATEQPGAAAAMPWRVPD